MVIPTPQFLEQCRFCDKFYSTSDEFAEEVGIFLIYDSATFVLSTSNNNDVATEDTARGTYSIISQFIAKEYAALNSVPILLARNRATNICYFCYQQLVQIELPVVLESFQVTLSSFKLSFNQAVHAYFPSELLDMVLQYANPLYAAEKTRGITTLHNNKGIVQWKQLDKWVP